MTALAPYLSTFLLEHLPRERNASPHTSEAYAHSFKLLICFAAARLNVKPCQVEVEQLDVPLVLAFLQHIENERGKVVRITENVNGRRDRIMVPADAIQSLKAALDLLLK